MPDHDELFKELIDTFLFDLLELFLPSVSSDIDPTFRLAIDRELPADLGPGRARRADLVYRIRNLTGEYFTLHIEVESSHDQSFAKRMLYYYVMLTEKFGLPVIPVAVLSFRSPQRRLRPTLENAVGELKFIHFEYIQIQLNQLAWRDFVRSDNRVAMALMANMKRSEAELAEVKLECLRGLARLILEPRQRTIALKFVDAYTPLTLAQQEEFKRRLSEFDPAQREAIMTYITSWERHGMEIGRAEGLAEGLAEGRAQGLAKAKSEKQQLVLLQLCRLLKQPIDPENATKIEGLPPSELDTLALDMLSFVKLEDLVAWLDG